MSLKSRLDKVEGGGAPDLAVYVADTFDEEGEPVYRHVWAKGELHERQPSETEDVFVKRITGKSGVPQ